jgi:hypothetical protein
VVGRENVVAGVDCGFGNFAGRVQVDTKIVWLKLQSLTEGAPRLKANCGQKRPDFSAQNIPVAVERASLPTAIDNVLDAVAPRRSSSGVAISREVVSEWRTDLAPRRYGRLRVLGQ